MFVGSPPRRAAASFRVVFVPGVAERVFPQKPRQDPLLPDALARAARASGSRRAPTRSVRERVLLHLAVGAATERLYLSYPRLDVAESRVRVPSFYALDAVRGVTGRMPDHEELAAPPPRPATPTLAWPAPSDPGQAIDVQEHDLAVLRELLDAADAASRSSGRAQYLLRLNEALRRTVTERWARGEHEVDAVRRAGARDRSHARGAGRAAADGAAVLGVGAAALLPPARISSS